MIRQALIDTLGLVVIIAIALAFYAGIGYAFLMATGDALAALMGG